MTDQENTLLKVCFIGGGNMARALIGGLCDNGAQPVCRASDIHVVDIDVVNLQQLQQSFGVSTCSAIDARTSAADIVLLSVKPQQMQEVGKQLLPFLTDQTVISIAAGIRIADLARWLGGYAEIVRTMPNMAALISQGMTGMVAEAGVSARRRAMAERVMRSVGQTLWLDVEAMLDPLTAISGSGPAYVFYFIEAMQKAASELGFSEEQGRQLALATFQGASQLAAQSEESAATLRQRVTSKGGTTHAAIVSMENSGVGAAIVKALAAAAARSRELGDEFGQ